MSNAIRKLHLFSGYYINIATLHGIDHTLRKLSLLFFTLDYEKKFTYDKLINRMEEKLAKITVLLDYAQHIHWIELTGVLSCRICSLPKQLDFLLHEDIWSKDNGYLQAVAQRLAELIAVTHGHTLILFTSYQHMEQTYTALQGMITDYPLFMMGKGSLDALDAFRKSGNGVLLASDSAGEGIDLAGDILSSLIVVRLPFPVSDPVLEYEKSLYSDFYSYLKEIIVPEMLTKLRQWIGRGIRRETDTCVFTILDSRASRHYKNDILAALPDMPVTDRLSDVGRFLLSKKDGSYFE